MAEYKVKLIMSDEFIVNVKSKEEAEQKHERNLVAIIILMM